MRRLLIAAGILSGTGAPGVLYGQEPATTPSAATTAAASDTKAPPSPEPASAAPADSSGASDAANQHLPDNASETEERLKVILSRPGGLTAQEAGARAAATSLEAQSERAGVEVAEQRVSQVLYRAVPKLTLTARYTRLSPIEQPSFGPSGSGGLVVSGEPPGPIPPDAQLVSLDGSGFSFPVPKNNYFLNAGLVVPLSDYLLSTRAAVNGAKALKSTALLNERAARVRAQANAQIAYYNWVRTELEAVVAEQSVQQAGRQLSNIEQNFRAGRVAEADVLSSRAFAASAELLEQRARTNAAIAKQQLQMLIHEHGKDFEIGEDVLAPFPGAKEQASLEQLYREAVEKRLEIQALSESAYSLEQSASVSDSDSYPRLELFGNVTLANPNPRIFPQDEEWKGTWDVGAQLVWSINDYGQNRAESRVTNAERKRIESQKQSLKDGLRTEILSAYRALQDAALGLKTAKQGLLAAETSYNARAQLLAYGRSTSLELQEAETALLRARLDLVNAHVAQRVARIQLDHAVGRDAAR